ncbi:MAG: diaminopimelate decarboxylase [Bacteroidaceae bacterium]|nr:diaminopimelate decarboxylase [Bacteroidaceae bacterium]
MKMQFPVEAFASIETPFYYYDVELLKATLDAVKREAAKYDGFHVHYAVKANYNPRLLEIVNAVGIGADCVSGGEVRAAISAGIPAGKVVFAGVGKTDKEIAYALDSGIFCFNVESVPEIEAIERLAAERGAVAQVAVRVNPNVGAHTHANITTGLAENKFGVNYEQLDGVIDVIESMPHIKLIGLHFHIGSQLLVMDDFIALCCRINELQELLHETRGMVLPHINVGGGLGVRYDAPDKYPIPDFDLYFATYANNLKLYPGQQLHFELGRSIVAQCGALITRATYIKNGTCKQFVVVDAGMNDLIRPAQYDAYHRIENLVSCEPDGVYDVVGPVCESSDVFCKDRRIPATKRGDILAIRTAGAYGEAMAFGYNCRELPKAVLSTDLNM